MTLDDDLRVQLHRLESRQRLRRTRPLAGPDRTRPHLGATPLAAFCSNDYLGLASHPALAEASARASRDHGFGAGASRLISGESPLHHELEESLAAYLGLPATLLFPSGYQANIGLITALAGPEDLIASDSANHASIIDGCRLSRAHIAVYAHADPVDARRALCLAGPFRRRLLVTESIFSMDGDRAPLAQLADLVAATPNAALLVDEAHALGVVGPRGRGLAADAGITPFALVGTLGKAFGTSGGVIAGSVILRDVLLNTARTFVFTTAPPPPIAAATLAALQIIDSTAGDDLRMTAASSARLLRHHLAHLHQAVPGEDLILPVPLGTDANALRVADALLARNYLIPAIRPPTVPEGTCRLRLTVSAAHTPAALQDLASTIAEILAA